MSQYADGFVIPIARSKLAAYRRMATVAAKVWKEHGALDYKECVGEDLNSAFALSFPKGIGAKRGETIIFSWITYRSRQHRDRVNARVMKDPRIAGMCGEKDMPFDCRRMLHGGFEVMVSI